MCGYRVADLRLWFCIYAKGRWSHDAAHIWSPTNKKVPVLNNISILKTKSFCEDKIVMYHRVC